MISKCCKAKPLFSLGYAHGVKMYDDKYFGVCSKCSEQSEFIIEGDDNHIFNINIAKQLVKDIEGLRDADFHVCKQDIFQSQGGTKGDKGEYPCTCEHFDRVIDKVQSLIINWKGAE